MHYKGSTGTPMTVEKKMDYRSDVFKSESEYLKYTRLAGRIERELGIRYYGKTEKGLMKFVKAYKNRLGNT